MRGTPDEFRTRVNGKRWPLFSRTQRRNELKSGDVIVFYLAGRLNKKLLGTGKVSSKLYSNEEHDFFVDISDVDVWKKDIPIKKLVASLSFIKNKDNWGLNLQGGVVPISKEDYTKIMNEK